MEEITMNVIALDEFSMDKITMNEIFSFKNE